MTPDDIQELFKRSEGEVQPAGGEDDEAVLTDEEKQYRIAHLRAVLLEAHNAWVSGSEDLDRIAEKLGDGSRHGEFLAPDLCWRDSSLHCHLVSGFQINTTTHCCRKNISLAWSISSMAITHR